MGELGCQKPWKGKKSEDRKHTSFFLLPFSCCSIFHVVFCIASRFSLFTLTSPLVTSRKWSTMHSTNFSREHSSQEISAAR